MGEICSGGTCGGATNTCLCKQDADCDSKEDGDFCNGSLFCNLQTGTCDLNPASVINCPTVDNTLCTKNACQPKTGKCELLAVEKAVEKCGAGGEDCAWVAASEAAAGFVPCDDGDTCTNGDVCALGKCSAGTFICTCKSNEECLDKDDGDLCNGIQY